MLANCLHDLAALGPGGLGRVLVAMLLAGLAGGVTHCAGMCAPFVIAQASTNAARHGGGTLMRLGGAALAPYHAGRMLGYSALGAVAGGSVGAVSQATGFRHVLGAMLLLAALLMIRQAYGKLPAKWRPKLPAWVHRTAAGSPVPHAGLLMPVIRRLLEKPAGWNGVGLGLLLSGLPCGLLYAALAAAAATGSALAGALGMLAFTVGTIPSLFGVALLGRFFLRGGGEGVRLAGAVLFLVNGAMLATTAWRLFA